MISRRLLRVKALQILYAYQANDNPSLQKAEKELLFSIEKSYDLYHLVLLLIINIASLARQRIDSGRTKYFPTPEETNPNTRFVENRIINRLIDHDQFNRYLDTRKISWAKEEEMIRNLYRDLLEWPEYKDYMNNPDDNFEQDKYFITRLVSDFILPSEIVSQVLEEQSIYWNDDLEFIGSMIIKTLGRWKAGGNLRMMSMFSNEDDRQFVLELFRQTILHADEYQQMIRKFAENWDFERLAIMDILIMRMAIVEAVHFPSIPTKVTLNEYIEIAKYYSTEKSSLFINGILDKIFLELKTTQAIKKSGRGLIGEV